MRSFSQEKVLRVRVAKTEMGVCENAGDSSV